MYNSEDGGIHGRSGDRVIRIIRFGINVRANTQGSQRIAQIADLFALEKKEKVESRLYDKEEEQNSRYWQ